MIIIKTLTHTTCLQMLVLQVVALLCNRVPNQLYICRLAQHTLHRLVFVYFLHIADNGNQWRLLFSAAAGSESRKRRR